MSNKTIEVDRDQICEILNDLQLNAGTLSSLTRLYENMSADLENGQCPGYISTVTLGAMQRGIIALAETVDRSIFELDSIVRREPLVVVPRAGGES